MAVKVIEPPMAIRPVVAVRTVVVVPGKAGPTVSVMSGDVLAE